MNAINYAIREVMFNISPEILRLAFADTFGRYRHRHLNIEDQIEALVIRPRVLTLCNLIGGVDINISLAGVPYEDVDIYHRVYRIPKSLTDGRSIVFAKSISFLDPYNQDLAMSSQMCGRSPLLQGIDNVINAANTIPYVGTHRVSLIAENTVLVRGQTIVPNYTHLLCTVSHDPNMNDINPRSIPVFADACLYAVKAYIHTELNIALGEGYLHGGRDLGEVKNVVDSYADANELFREFRNPLAKMLFFNDEVKFERHLKALFHGPN